MILFTGMGEQVTFGVALHLSSVRGEDNSFIAPLLRDKAADDPALGGARKRGQKTAGRAIGSFDGEIGVHTKASGEHFRQDDEAARYDRGRSYKLLHLLVVSVSVLPDDVGLDGIDVHDESMDEGFAGCELG